ncbi:gephyrin-like molybdotransferase Glp [Sphingobacterium sp. GVS05A]|uniref:NTP transferase domain-containing protein n=1 Tax=Sphingobacterium TaxID=28453 RepID=UPI001CBE9E75|nr:gephyrin-like molybdotransferase Glp [Sphingobacterium sp. GVS05A]
MTKQTGIIILAAGNSSRLGLPKQLLEFEGEPLLKRISRAAMAVPDVSVSVVIGAYPDPIHAVLQNSKVSVAINPHWMAGLSTSIIVGLKDLLKNQPQVDRCIISLCDQPFVDQHVFQQLIQLADSSGKGIVATGFSGTWGAPVLFDKKYFDSLMQLEGQQGAKKLAEQHFDDRIIFPYEAAKYDVDTQEDYFRLPHQFISVQQARDIIHHYLPAPREERLALPDALGYTLSQTVIAAQAIPGFAQSSMDGYALRFVDRALELPVADKIPAGTTTVRTLSSGQAMRIYTGAPLPLGADTVVMQEKVRLSKTNTILIQDEALILGDNVRPEGSEVEAGSIAMLPGTTMTPAAIGFLANIGCTEVMVYAAPLVHIILTGDELRSTGTALGYGEVYESNSYQLKAALRQLGIYSVESSHVRDDKSLLHTALEGALEKADVVLLVGGVSVGDYDYVVDVAKGCGVKQHFHRIRQKPGKPLFFGTREQKLVFGLPGNPSSALTCFYLYVAAALERIMRLPERNRCIKTNTTRAYSKKPGLTHFLKAHYDGHAVEPLHAQESYRLQSYAQANCLLILEEDSEGCTAGDEVFIHLLT